MQQFLSVHDVADPHQLVREALDLKSSPYAYESLGKHKRLLMLFFKKYMQKPMHLFGNTGLLLFGLGAIINLYLLGLKILGQDIWGKPLLLLGIMLVLAGVQFITVGIVVEIQMRTYFESQQKKPYKIRTIETFGQEGGRAG